MSCLDTHIKQRRLSSSTRAHQRRQSTWLDKARNMVQQTSRLALDLDIIVNLAPSEYVLLWRNDIDISFFIILLVGFGHFLISSTKLFVVGFALGHVLHVLWDMSTSEDQHFSAGRGFRVDLNGNEIHGQESEQEGQ